LAIGDERAVVVRVGAEIRAYRNRCAQGDADLAGANVTDGLITCRVHRWNYRATDGVRIGSSQKLERLPVEIVSGEAFVMMPDDNATDRPDRLLAADRDDTWPNGMQRPTGQ
jgi:nitrite reductase/ring-hydroxylating ferredoxin subunit